MDKVEIGRIVVPLDGSELAEHALPLAAAIATKTDGHIDLVTVALTGEIPIESQMDTMTTASLHRAEAAVEARHPKVGRTILTGHPAEQISRHARETGADLIVMATHGRTGFRKFLLGSVADSLLSTSMVPVLLVRSDNSEPVKLPLVESHIDRLIVPLDGTGSTPAAIPIAFSIARAADCGTLLVYADENGSSSAGDRQLRAFASEFKSNGLKVETETLHGKPGEVIVEAAGAGDIVVMSSLSATGVARGSHRGSVADYVAKHARCPVLIVAPRGYLGSAIE